MERSPFLPLPEGMILGQVELTQTQLTVEVISTQPCVHCPECGNSSDAVHCQYQRTVHDVPCGGRKVVLRLKERGYTGSRALLGRLIAEWRTELPPKPRPGKPRKPRLVAKSGQRRLSSRRASFLRILPPEKLTVVQRQQLEYLCQAVTSTKRT